MDTKFIQEFCFPFPEMLYYGSNREDFVSGRLVPSALLKFVLDPDNIWYGRLKLLFSISVKTDVSDEVKKIE